MLMGNSKAKRERKRKKRKRKKVVRVEFVYRNSGQINYISLFFVQFSIQNNKNPELAA